MMGSTAGLVEIEVVKGDGRIPSPEDRPEVAETRHGELETQRPTLPGPVEFTITDEVYRAVERTIGSRRAEQGGMLGGVRSEGIVRVYEFDKSARRSGATYSPDHLTLNELLSQHWNPNGIQMMGFVHSHPGTYAQPSEGDRIYARKFLDANPEMEYLLMPIVLTQPNAGRFQIVPFAAYRHGTGVRVERMDLVIVDQEGKRIAARFREDAAPEPAKVTITAPAALPAQVTVPVGFPLEGLSGERVSESTWQQLLTSYTRFNDRAWQDTTETFRRVGRAYDLRRLARCRVIYIGTGGAAQFAEDMARAGVGEHVLIDKDAVAESNLATQQTYRRDIARAKVDCIAERIRDINPNAVVEVRPQWLDDIDDAEFERLAGAPMRTGILATAHWGLLNWDLTPEVTLICGLTDSFSAQARVNRLALQFGLPSLCAQVYLEGRGAEVTFTHPETTPACQRCALSSRYKAYLEDEYHNAVTSDGTPIFATTRLNALKGFVAMAILHHGTSHRRWGGLLRRIGDRNLIQIRMDPDLDLPVFERVYGAGDRERILFDDVVWLPQKPDCPANGFPHCPDCGGIGNLLDAKGTFADTRVMRGVHQEE